MLSIHLYLYLPDLPSEGTLGNFVAVLGSHTELGIQLGPDKVQVDGWGAAYHLYENTEKEKTAWVSF